MAAKEFDDAFDDVTSAEGGRDLVGRMISLGGLSASAAISFAVLFWVIGTVW